MKGARWKGNRRQAISAPASTDSLSARLIRSVVVGALGSHRTSPAAVDLMVGLLTDSSADVRVSALGSLGFRRQPRTLPDICRLADDSGPRVRAWVAMALGRFPVAETGDAATAAVLERLRTDPDPQVREEATKSTSVSDGRRGGSGARARRTRAPEDGGGEVNSPRSSGPPT
ncbi:HEAT repeat domain-containing protein [Streptomyces sp. NPDC005251]|uniref:HEAT repeat domain-containing protein n=1 Tax=Streptomyces sp. NPDC005251 TaxID=3157166 RepID=UPI0033B11ECF